MPRERPLTPKQHVILRYIARGLTNKEIASELGISEQGVKVHISRLLERYGAANRVELVSLTRSWSDAEERSYASMSGDIADMRVALTREAGSSMSLSDLRKSPDAVTYMSRDLPSGAPDDIVASLASLRTLLGEVDIAVKLARELPAEAASGPLVDAIRSRIRTAIAESDRLTDLLKRQGDSHQTLRGSDRTAS
jgi:DNA-binding CsgD family transcriptional regulator